jgi:hypothetical protein
MSGERQPAASPRSFFFFVSFFFILFLDDVCNFKPLVSFLLLFLSIFLGEFLSSIFWVLGMCPLLFI